jgi:hypothetical protein
LCHVIAQPPKHVAGTRHLNPWFIDVEPLSCSTKSQRTVQPCMALSRSQNRFVVGPQWNAGELPSDDDVGYT